MSDKYSHYRQSNEDLVWSPSSNASNEYSLSSMGFDSPPEYSTSLPPINILGRESTLNNSRSLPSSIPTSIPLGELSINPSHITVPPPHDIDRGLGLIDDNGVAMTSLEFDGDALYDAHANDNDIDNDSDDDYADDLVEGGFDDDDEWVYGGAEHAQLGSSTTAATHTRRQSTTTNNTHNRAKSPTPIIDADIHKRSRGRRVPTHDNQRVFKCPDTRCQKVFVRNEHLKRHIKSLHRDEKPYECLDQSCNKRFTRLDNAYLSPPLALLITNVVHTLCYMMTSITAIKPRLRVLFKDNLVMVVDKRPGMLSQGGKHSRLSIDDYLEDLKLDYEYPPKPLHRLDYQTSGCLLLGRTDRAAKQFSSALANNKVSKEYWALVENIHKVHNDRGVINDPISLSSSGRPYVGGDRAASTQWEILRHNANTGVGLCKFQIKTGRKHQIRLHASQVLGWPIVGDKLYNAGTKSRVLHLHARSLEFERFYKSRSGKAHKEQVRVEAPIPGEWAAEMEKSGFEDLLGLVYLVFVFVFSSPFMSQRALFNEAYDISEDLFSDSLEAIFGHHQVNWRSLWPSNTAYTHQPSQGEPGARFSYRSPWKTLDIRIPNQPTGGLFSQMQWDSGLYLSDMISDGLDSFNDLSHKRVLEFGAGTGLPSLLAALRGCPHVVCSDYDDAALIDNLRRNVAVNEVQNVHVVPHIWGQDASALIPPSDGRKFNLILCADTLWMSDQLENLLKSLVATIDTQDESSRVVIIAGFHTNRPPLAKFFRLAKEYGLIPDERGIKEWDIVDNTVREFTYDGVLESSICSRWKIMSYLRYASTT
ncbi:hypothetical protein E3P99_02704 [Wallemia hederae]|uniref:21S rRNA pseudouridine(2819) synthase n=1 Tax=Wallemia hederae TaxID=1540922 RepID=A0A4T0FJB8_9BASI|nr:hypothetical protein E3P99_02704 [Wallemia hederae]